MWHIASSCWLEMIQEVLCVQSLWLYVCLLDNFSNSINQYEPVFHNLEK